MPSLKRTHSKLLVAGFVPEEQSEFFEKWIDARFGGTAISFHRTDDRTDAFKVGGLTPDVAAFDEFSSYYTANLSEAIRVSRIRVKR